MLLDERSRTQRFKRDTTTCEMHKYNWYRSVHTGRSSTWYFYWRRCLNPESCHSSGDQLTRHRTIEKSGNRLDFCNFLSAEVLDFPENKFWHELDVDCFTIQPSASRAASSSPRSCSTGSSPTEIRTRESRIPMADRSAADMNLCEVIAG